MGLWFPGTITWRNSVRQVLIFLKHSVKFGSTLSIGREVKVRVNVKLVSVIRIVWGPQNRGFKMNCKVLSGSNSKQGELVEVT